MEENFSNGVSLQAALGSLVSTRQAKPNLALTVLFIFLGLILLRPGIGLLSEKAYVVGSVCLILWPGFNFLWSRTNCASIKTALRIEDEAGSKNAGGRT